jgi:hypothetical protein
MKYFSIEKSVDRVHGLVDRAAPWSTVDRRHRARLELTGELAERCHVAPKLTAAAREGRGRRRGDHNGQNWSGGGEVAPAAERNGTRRRYSVLGGSGHG